MNSKERVKSTIQRRPADRTPYSFDLTMVINNMIASYFGIDTSLVHEFIGDDLRYIALGKPTGFEPIKINDDRIADEFGVIWDRGRAVQNIGDWGGIVSSPLLKASLDGYKFPDGSAHGRFDYLDQDALKASGRYVIVGMDGIFDGAWHVRGFENLLMDFSLEESFTEELLDKVLEFNLGVISQVPSFVDGIRFGEDWGQQHGLLMGPKFWRKYLKPRLKIMYEAAKKRGFDVFIHTCGDIHDLFPDLIEIGVDVVNPVQPEVMDVEAIKKEYGKDIVMYGGMGSQSVIPLGSPDEVIKEAIRLLEVLGKDGGYIFGPAGAIPTDAKQENVIALVEFVMNGYKTKNG